MEQIKTVVVSASSVLKALKGNEVALNQAAEKRAVELVDDWQKAALMAQFGEALEQLQAAEDDAGPRVLHSPQNAIAARRCGQMTNRQPDRPHVGVHFSHCPRRCRCLPGWRNDDGLH
jgi:hypothetical protein